MQSNIKKEDKSYYSWKDLYDMQVTSVPFLWEGIIPQQGIGFLTGPSDSNKSTFLRQLGYAVVRKDELFLGRKLNATRGQSLIISTEDNSIALAAMVRKQTATAEDEKIMGRLNFSVRVPSPKQLDIYLTKIPCDFVGFDTWTDSFEGDLNQTVAVRKSLQPYHHITEKHNCSLICLHHTRKGSEGENPHKGQMLGSQGLEAKARFVMDLRRSGNGINRQLTITKGNYSTDATKAQPIMLKLKEDSMILELSDEQPAPYGFGKNLREHGRQEFFTPHIIKMRNEGLSFEKIVVALEEQFPDNDPPSKGTIHKWFKDSGGGHPDSQSPRELND
jgi:hypothetical protein